MKIFFYCATLFYLAIGLGSAFKLIPPNKFVGVRTARTLADETAWYAANQRVGIVMVIASIALLLVFGWIYRQDYTPEKATLFASIALVIGVLIPLAFAFK